ncbi:MAG: hypothetical protein WCG95_05885 [bacterium]
MQIQKSQPISFQSLYTNEKALFYARERRRMLNPERQKSFREHFAKPTIEKIVAPNVDSPFVQATTAIAQGRKKLSFVSIQLPKPRLVPFSKKPLFERIAVLFRKRQFPEFYTKYV